MMLLQSTPTTMSESAARQIAAANQFTEEDGWTYTPEKKGYGWLVLVCDAEGSALGWL